MIILNSLASPRHLCLSVKGTPCHNNNNHSNLRIGAWRQKKRFGRVRQWTHFACVFFTFCFCRAPVITIADSIYIHIFEYIYRIYTFFSGGIYRVCGRWRRKPAGRRGEGSKVVNNYSKHSMEWQQQAETRQQKQQEQPVVVLHTTLANCPLRQDETCLFVKHSVRVVFTKALQLPRAIGNTYYCFLSPRGISPGLNEGPHKIEAVVKLFQNVPYESVQYMNTYRYCC